MASRKSPEYIFPGGFTIDSILEDDPKLVLPHDFNLDNFNYEEKLFLLAALEQSLQLEEDTLTEYFYTLGKGDYLVFALGDLHFGSTPTDYAKLLQIQQFILKWPNSRLILLGDEIDGRGKHPTNDIRNMKSERQKKLFRAWARPLVNAGKIICTVGEYEGHNGWEIATGATTWKDLFGPDMDVPIIGNGELLRLIAENYEEGDSDLLTVTTAHNSGRKSPVDPVHGLRALAQREGSDLALGGHFHQFGEEQTMKYGPGGMVEKRTLVNSGAFKGSNRKLPRDPYGQQHALGYVSPPGSGVLLRNDSDDSKIDVYPFAYPAEGMLLHAALQLLNDVEAQRLTEELLGEIKRKAKSQLKADEKNDDGKLSLGLRHILAQSEIGVEPSRTETQQWQEEQEKITSKLRKKGLEIPDGAKSQWFPDPYKPEYRNLVARVNSHGLPFAIHYLSNLGLGVRSFRQEAFEKYLAQLDQPYDLLLWLRGIVDKDAGELPNRQLLLDQVVSWMSQAEGRNLALLIDGALRAKAWKKSVKGFFQQEEVTEQMFMKSRPLAPASTISRESKVPLLSNLGTLELRIGNNQLVIGAMDRLLNSGSFTNPFLGLQTAYRNGRFPVQPMVTVGGHMIGSGFAKGYDGVNKLSQYPTFIAPGGWRQVDTAGKGNVMEWGPPEMSTIIVPVKGRLFIFPTQGIEQYQTFIDALTIQSGLLKHPGLLKLVQSKHPFTNDFLKNLEG